MKFSMIHKFPFPVEPVIEMLKNGEDLCPMEELPNVSSRKVVESRREGKKMYNKIEWNVHGQIPKVAQKLIKPEMLSFTEHTVWDDDDCSFTTTIEPHALKDKVDVKTKSKWYKNSDNQTERKFGGDLKVKIPIIGQVVEKAFIDYLKKNNDKNAVLVKKHLSKKFGV